MKRRLFLQGLGALTTLPTAAFASPLAGAKPRVVIIGGGFAGAMAARQLCIGSQRQIDVTVIEPRAEFICAPLSNLVVGGVRPLASMTFSYRDLAQREGINWINGSAKAINGIRRIVTLADGTQLPYDRLIVSPGIDFMWEELVGMDDLAARQRVLHAWKGDAQLSQLFAQIAAMRDGGHVVISIPLAPLRCPPAPYERACLIADYLARSKNRCKVIVLDANADVLSQAKQFKQIWNERYRDLIEYRPNFTCAEVHAASSTLVSDFGDKVQGDVLNVIPPQRAGDIAMHAGLANSNHRWCEVDFLTFESTQMPDVHVLGDAIQIASQMPKAAQMASQQARVCAAAIINLFDGREPDANSTLTSTCYSFVSEHQAMHLRSRHRYDAREKTFLPVPVEFAASQPNGVDADEADGWKRQLVADCLA